MVHGVDFAAYKTLTPSIMYKVIAVISHLTPISQFQLTTTPWRAHSDGSDQRVLALFFRNLHFIDRTI